MKNRLLTFAGGLLLLAALGKFFATPAMAQILRAVLVRNVDEKGRSPYMQFMGRSCSGQGSTACDIVFPPVPPGKRLVVERLNGTIIFAPGGVHITALIAPSDILFLFPVRPTDPTVKKDSVSLVNEATLVYFEAGASPTFRVVFNDAADVPVISSTISGYLVDLETRF